jgi:cytoskeletal protein CcmA (bactofilin family)
MILPAKRNTKETLSAISQDNGTVIGSSVKINGGLKSNGNIQVDGYFEGTVEGKLVYVSDIGYVKGRIIADSVTVSGVAHGEIVATSKVHILDGSKVYADIKAPAIGIEPGAVFNGKTEMGDIEDIDRYSEFDDEPPKQVEEEKTYYLE